MPTRPFTWLGIVVTVGWIVAWLRRLDTVEVRGGSMAPTLLPGDRLIVHRATGTPNVGDVVVAGDPRQPRRELVKRVVAIRDARVTVRGDNPDASTDSRAFGELPLAGVRWRVAARYWPPSRIGLIPPAPLQALGPVEGDRVEGSTISTASVAGK